MCICRFGGQGELVISSKMRFSLCVLSMRKVSLTIARLISLMAILKGICLAYRCIRQTSQISLAQQWIFYRSKHRTCPP